MNLVLRYLLFVFAICSWLSHTASAGLFDCCCRRCERPLARCGCPQPIPCAVPQILPQAPPTQLPAPTPAQQTSYQPVIETQYVQQPTVTYRDVVETQYRTEPVSQTVPVTTYENVSVDEGSYQSVWVPRMVTKQVPRVGYQTQTSYRQVPYQVSRRVPEYGTQSVPTQTVRYVPSTTGVQNCAPGNVPATATLTYPQTLNQNAYAVPPVSATATYPPPYSVVGTGPTPASASLASSTGSSLAPIPDPHFANSSDLTPITPRTASRFETYKNRHVVSEPEVSSRRTASREPMFVPAPSAAAVFRTPRGTALQ